MTITQADREAAGAFLRSDGCPLNAKMTIHPRALIEAFARHREAAEREAMERALKALKSAKYSPAPYTDGVKAIRALCPTPRPDDSDAWVTDQDEMAAIVRDTIRAATFSDEDVVRLGGGHA